jgi:energy-converting hydrogenase Eha subunit C
MKILIQIFRTKIGWLVICLLLAGLFLILSDYYDSLFFPIAMYASLVYPVGLTLVLLTYAWIINPLRERKENKKLQNGNK